MPALTARTTLGAWSRTSRLMKPVAPALMARTASATSSGVTSITTWATGTSSRSPADVRGPPMLSMRMPTITTSGARSRHVAMPCSPSAASPMTSMSGSRSSITSSRRRSWAWSSQTTTVIMSSCQRPRSTNEAGPAAAL